METESLLKIGRNDKWKGFKIIPGGRLEVGESVLECGRREFNKEFGAEALDVLEVGDFLVK